MIDVWRLTEMDYANLGPENTRKLLNAKLDAESDEIDLILTGIGDPTTGDMLAVLATSRDDTHPFVLVDLTKE